MTLRRAIVQIGGTFYELPAGDTLAGVGSVTTVLIDFGSNLTFEKTFDVTLTGATLGQKAVASISLDMPTDVAEDELEMDMIAVAAKVIATDTVRIVAASIRGPVSGQRNVNIFLG